MRFHCVACGETAGEAYEAFCKCGSMIDVEYDPARVRLEESANPYVRFRDLLPLASTRDRLPSDARYSPAIHAKAQMRHFGMRDASFVDAFNHAAAYAAQHKLVSERGFFKSRPARRTQDGVLRGQVPGGIDWYVQAVSSAMGVYGTYKGAKELKAIGHVERVPKLLCAQQESCAPLVNAYVEGAAKIEPRHVVARPHGIAEAILRGDPSRVYPCVKSIVVESGGDCVSVTENEIREARRLTEELGGVLPCFSAATAVAGLFRQVESGKFPREDTALVNLTGGDRPRTRAAESVRWLRREGDGWIEERAVR